jgi:acyl-coenzyme A thioesterase PaaI-like protein
MAIDLKRMGEEIAGQGIKIAWDNLTKVPGGKTLFSRLLGKAAPYTGSMNFKVEELRDGYSSVVLRDQRATRNHLNCVHAIALANLAEVTANAAMAYSMPSDTRFIVAGMEVEYLKKARGNIVATANCPVPETSEKREYDVPVSMRNKGGEEVARAKFRTLIGPKRQAA